MNLSWIWELLFTTKPAVDEAPGVFPGVLLDTRSDEEKAMDITLKDIVPAGDIALGDMIEWREKPEREWRTFPVQDQAGQSSCVANSGRKCLRVMYQENNKIDLDFSSLDIYRRRRNYPAPGMASYDLWRVLAEGATLNVLAPSDGKTEAEANALAVKPYMRDVGAIFKVRGAGVNLPIGDIDAVAATIKRTKKGVVLFYYMTYNEYARETPVTLAPPPTLEGANTIRHAITAVDYTLINGVKHLICEDSAHFGGFSRRLISERFHKARNFYAGYPMNFVFDPPATALTHTFNTDLEFGQTNDEVRALQECLQSVGHFPANVSASGYYGALTAQSVLAFQKEHLVAAPWELDRLAGKRCGPGTRAALNILFA